MNVEGEQEKAFTAQKQEETGMASARNTVVQSGVPQGVIYEGNSGTMSRGAIQHEAQAEGRIHDPNVSPGMPPKTINVEAFSGAHHFNLNGDFIVAGGNVTQVRNENIVHVHSSHRDVLNLLPNPTSTSWDPSRACLAGTRTEIIQEVHSWLSSKPTNNAARIFLLADAAGSGKSSLAHTVAGLAHDRGLLVASFFFNQLNGDHSTTRYLFGALVRGLYLASQEARAIAIELLEADHTLATAPPTRQFNDLILPICSAFPPNRVLAIIIDALDEGYDMDLLTILRDHIPRLPPHFRIFLTARPDEQILRYLDQKPHIYRCTHSLSGIGSQQDIEKYIDHEISECDELSTLSPELKAELVQKAEGVFLWAETVLNHVKWAFDPLDELEQVLRSDSGYWRDDQNAGQKLDTLYGQVLSRFAWNDPAFVAAYRKVIGSVVTLAEPLSVDSLVKLYADEGISARSITKVASRMRPLLDGFDPNRPELPLRLLHLSVREYLVERAPHPYHLNPEHHHPVLCGATFSVIDKELIPSNISILGFTRDPLRSSFSIPALDAARDHISPQLRYACQYMMHHVNLTKPADFPLARVPLLFRALSTKTRSFLEITAAMDCTFNLGQFRRWSLEVSSKHEGALKIDRSMEEEFANSLHSLLLFKDLRLRPVDEWMIITGASEICLFMAGMDMKDCLPSLDYRSYSSSLAAFEAALSVARRSVKISEGAGSEIHVNETNFILSRSLMGVAMNWRTVYTATGRPAGAIQIKQTMDEAVDILRQLSRADPRVYDLHLATTLFVVSRIHQNSDKEAIDVVEFSEEAVARLRTLVSEKHDDLEEELAESLLDLSVCSKELGRYVLALSSIVEAVDIRRRIYSSDPSPRNGSRLAGFLCILSECQYLLCNQHAARKAASEAVDIYRRHVSHNTGHNNTTYELAHGLVILMNYGYDGSGDDISILALNEEVVELCRQLVRNDAETYDERLANALLNLGLNLSRLERYDEAIPVFNEAIGIGRRLFHTVPLDSEQAHYLPSSLHSLSFCHIMLQNYDSALTVIEEAVSIRRQKYAMENSTVEDMNSLANSLSMLADCLFRQGQDVSAQKCLEEMEELTQGSNVCA